MTDLPRRRRSHAAVSLGLLHSRTCTVPNFFVHTHTHTRSCLFNSIGIHMSVQRMHVWDQEKKSPPKLGSCKISHYQRVWKQQLIEMRSSARVLSSGPLVFFLTSSQEIIFWSECNPSLQRENFHSHLANFCRSRLNELKPMLVPTCLLTS